MANPKQKPKYQVGDPVEVDMTDWGIQEIRPGRILTRHYSKYGGWSYLVQFEKGDFEVREFDINPAQQILPMRMKSGLSKKRAYWIEKSRDMYHVEQKPVGKDRKKILGPAPTHIPNTYTELPQDRMAVKQKPKYLAGDRITYAISGKSYPGVVRSFEWSPTWHRYLYRLEIDGHEIAAWEEDVIPSQGRLFAMKSVTAGEVVPFKRKTKNCPHCGNSSTHDAGGNLLECDNCKQLFKKSMKIEAADILQFDPNKRKKQMSPQTSELTQEMQDDREAVFYHYDTILQDLKGLFSNLIAIGEKELANNIRAAYQSLTGEILYE